MIGSMRVGDRLYYTPAEIEALVKKAAYGGGYCWGLAEEMAKSAKFLAAYSLPSLALVARLLGQKTCPPRLNPSNKSIMRSNDNLLCPITAGVMLGDRAAQLKNEGDYCSLEALHYPLLLLPCLARAACFYQRVFRITWQNSCAYVGEQGFSYRGCADLPAAESGLVTVTDNLSGDIRLADFSGKPIQLADLDIVKIYFMRTTVPESPASRLRGAGADS